MRTSRCPARLFDRRVNARPLTGGAAGIAASVLSPRGTAKQAGDVSYRPAEPAAHRGSDGRTARAHSWLLVAPKFGFRDYRENVRKWDFGGGGWI